MATPRRGPHADPASASGSADRLHPLLALGTSGWAYTSWKPGFYPQDVAASRFLPYYAGRLNSVEVNYTFRKLPSAATIAAWLHATPADFRFSFKAPQRITHFNRLRDCNQALQELLAVLKPVVQAGKMGALLFQLPANFKSDPDRLRSFLAEPVFRRRSMPRIAFEFRNESWFTEETYAILRRRNAAMCIAESDDLRTPEVHCSTDFAYYRLRCGGRYKSQEISQLAETFRSLLNDRNVFAYLKHEEKPTGPINALALQRACMDQAAAK